MHDVYSIQYFTGTERINVAKVAVNNVYAILFFDLEDHESSSSSCHTRYCILNYFSPITIRIRLWQKFTHCLEYRRLHDNYIFTRR